jgi:hypothetical protein
MFHQTTATSHRLLHEEHSQDRPFSYMGMLNITLVNMRLFMRTNCSIAKTDDCTWNLLLHDFPMAVPRLPNVTCLVYYLRPISMSCVVLVGMLSSKDIPDSKLAGALSES